MQNEQCVPRLSGITMSIKQGETISVSGRISSGDYPLDASSMNVKFMIWSRTDELVFSTDLEDGSEEIILRDNGLITFEIPGSRTQEMLGTYYIECEISKNGERIVSDNAVAFEVVKSKIAGRYGWE